MDKLLYGIFHLKNIELQINQIKLIFRKEMMIILLVEVEEKKLQAMKNAEAAAEDAKTEGDLVSSDAVVDLEEDK